MIEFQDFHFPFLFPMGLSIMINAQRNRTGWIDPTDHGISSKRALKPLSRTSITITKEPFQVMMDGVIKDSITSLKTIYSQRK